jgi:hypothetical protein
MLPNFWLMGVAGYSILKTQMRLPIPVIELLDQDRVLKELKENAYKYGLHLRWPVVGAEYIK